MKYCSFSSRQNSVVNICLGLLSIFLLNSESANSMSRNIVRLPGEVNRILYVRNLPYKITAEELYDIFGKFGAIRQIRK